MPRALPLPVPGFQPSARFTVAAEGLGAWLRNVNAAAGPSALPGTSSLPIRSSAFGEHFCGGLCELRLLRAPQVVPAGPHGGALYCGHHINGEPVIACGWTDKLSGGAVVYLKGSA